MAGWKPIARLGLGWALMLAGAIAIFDSGTALRPQNKLLSGAEALGGFALVVAGWWLRRRVTRNDNQN
jgi:hypothetical protein